MKKNRSLLRFCTLPGEHREVMRISLPLVLSMGATTVMEFTDRVFLGRYSLDALAAAMPSGLMVLLVMTIFLGTAGYVAVFVAQYAGARQYEKVGIVLWQGIYFTLAAVCVFVGLGLMGPVVFECMGHPAVVKDLEIRYFSMLCSFAGFNILGAVFSGVFTGLGRTRPVLLGTLLGMCINIPLDYCLINGVWIFPELGIRGAAFATGSSWAFMTLLLGFLLFTPRQVAKFSLFVSKRMDRSLLVSLIRFGFPNGLQFFLDVFAFTVFAAIVGRIGLEELAATNIVLNINAIVFMPLVGFSMGTSTLVGQALGAGNPKRADRMTMASLQIAGVYTLLVGVVCLVFPDTLLGLFKPLNLTVEEYAPVLEMGRYFLYFVLVYLGFDVLSFVLSGALKGAGDMSFLMWITAAATVFFMLIPLGVGVLWWGLGVYFAWACTVAYAIFLGIFMTIRYRTGKWRNMLVIG